jgi:hypothetical protein
MRPIILEHIQERNHSHAMCAAGHLLKKEICKNMKGYTRETSSTSATCAPRHLMKAQHCGYILRYITTPKEEFIRGKRHFTPSLKNEEIRKQLFKAQFVPQSKLVNLIT